MTKTINMIKMTKLAGKHFNVRVHLSSQVCHQMSIQDNTAGVHDQGALYIDGGTNICVMGKQFRLTSKSMDRYVDMEGFANGLTKSNIRICNGLTVVETALGNKVLLGIKEAPYLPSNKHSLLSSGQAREARTWVGDTLRRHGGDQTIAQASFGDIIDFDRTSNCVPQPIYK